MRITKRKMNRRFPDGRVVVLERYVLNFIDPKTGKRAQRFFAKQKEAQRAQSELLVQIEQGTYCTRKDVPTVAEVFEHWFADRKGQVRDVTINGYAQHRNYICGPLLVGTPEQRIAYTATRKLPEGCHLEPMLGDIKVNDLTTGEIRKWHKKLGDMVGTYSANRAKQHLQTILALAAEDFGARPPMMPRRLGRGKGKEKKSILTPEQVGLLLLAARNDAEYGIYYAFPFLAGTRPSEQLGLLWSEVDLDKRIIRICRILDRREGLVEVTKTSAGQREIPICQPLYEMLLEWKLRCPRKDGELGYVFPGLGQRQKWPLPRTNGGGALSYANFRNRVWTPAFELLAKQGIPYVTPHSARHTFISTLQAQQVEVGLVAKLAGHANPAVTLGHYTQAVRGGNEAIEQLAVAFSIPQAISSAQGQH